MGRAALAVPGAPGIAVIVGIASDDYAGHEVGRIADLDDLGEGHIRKRSLDILLSEELDAGVLVGGRCILVIEVQDPVAVVGAFDALPDLTAVQGHDLRDVLHIDILGDLLLTVVGDGDGTLVHAEERSGRSGERRPDLIVGSGLGDGDFTACDKVEAIVALVVVLPVHIGRIGRAVLLQALEEVSCSEIAAGAGVCTGSEYHLARLLGQDLEYHLGADGLEVAVVEILAVIQVQGIIVTAVIELAVVESLGLQAVCILAGDAAVTLTSSHILDIDGSLVVYGILHIVGYNSTFYTIACK